jgi:hypothetical protein
MGSSTPPQSWNFLQAHWVIFKNASSPQLLRATAKPEVSMSSTSIVQLFWHIVNSTKGSLLSSSKTLWLLKFF